jgi:hypothetical protein
MEEALKPETLKALEGIIAQASQSYLGYAALATIVLAFALYILSLRQNGMTPVNLAAFGFMVLFVILASAAAYFSAAQMVTTLYYAGKDEGDTVFNVGRFMQLSPTEWEDDVLSRVSLDGTGKARDGLVWHYKLENKGPGGKVWLLKGTDSNREDVVIQIDWNMKEINYIENGNVHTLYHIIDP